LVDYYKTGGTKIKFWKRLKKAKEIAKKIGCPNIRVMWGTKVANNKDLKGLLKKVLRQKHEGLVAKNLDGIGVVGRSPDWRKLKPTKDRTVVVIGMEEGEGRLQGRLGAFVCKDPKTKEVFNCGGSWKDPGTGESSLSDSERKRLWRGRKKIIGKLIDVIEQDEGKGKRASMYARFKGFRDDLTLKVILGG